jgi:hypothetical protein
MVIYLAPPARFRADACRLPRKGNMPAAASQRAVSCLRSAAALALKTKPAKLITDASYQRQRRGGHCAGGDSPVTALMRRWRSQAAEGKRASADAFGETIL